MAHIKVYRQISAPHRQVWAALADLESHTDWMRDARSIIFTSEQTTGVGTAMEVETVVGPLRTQDVMRVVGWEEGRSIDVIHEGLVSGRGQLSLRSHGPEITLVSWEETLLFPWWLGGRITAWLARPVLRFIWKGNLERLERTLTSP